MKSIFIISGEKGSGKSTFLIDVTTLLQMNGFVVGGFVANHGLQTDNYFIRNVETNVESLLMQRTAGFDKRPNHFKLFPEGVEIGKIWIKEILQKRVDIVVIDEIGGFELDGELWCKDFTTLLESSTPLIFTVKTKHIDKVLKKWNINPAFIFNLTYFGNYHKAFEKISKLL